MKYYGLIIIINIITIIGSVIGILITGQIVGIIIIIAPLISAIYMAKEANRLREIIEDNKLLIKD